MLFMEGEPNTRWNGVYRGHMIPGTLISTIAIWSTINIYLSYFKEKTRRGPPYKSRAFYSGPFCHLIPLESVAKIAGALTMVLAEIDCCSNNGRLVSSENYQHMMVYTTIFLCGVFEILHHTRILRNNSLEPVGGLVVIAMYGILFHYHLNSVTPLASRAHTMLVLLSMLSWSAALCEIWHKNTVLWSLVRAFVFQVIGTWLIHVAFMLYGYEVGFESWDDHEKNLRWFNFMFICHLIGNAFLSSCVGGIVWTLMDS